LRRSFVDRLKAAVGEAPPHALRALLGPQRIRLERLRLELTLRDPDRRGKRKRTGVFPIVLDTRYRTGDERLRFAYHPLRQLEVLAIDERQELAPQLAAFFGDRWGALDDDGLEALKAHARDRVAPLALSVKPRSLLDQLERRKKSVWDDLKVDPTRGKKGKAPRRGQPSLLRRLGRDLTERAASELLELGRPREPQRSQLQQLLCVPHPRSLALLGPPGVGKRTLLRRAIDDLLRHDGFDAHRNLDEVTHVWELAASRLIAGMSYLGQWEQRCVEIVEAVRGRRVILAFEDLHTLGRVGRSKESERSMADFFRGPVQRGELVLLGTATPAQWRRLEEDAPAFASLFGTLRVEPASAAETRRMLLHEARRLEAERPELTFEPEAFRAILEHGAPLLANQALPGKALDLLHALAGGSSVDEQAVLHLLTQRTGLMADLIAPLEGDDRQSAVEDLAAEVMGQPEAVEAAADLVMRIRAGLTDPGRPWGAYLFTGPTGTGKTQLTKTLASYLFGDDRLVRFDMGELSGPDAVARLIGDRWEPRGMLTEAVRQQPFCVLLLDEIEKAHPSVLYLLLQLLDDGRLTDATGELVDFRHAVVVLTSNLGARARPAVGFGEESAASVEAEVTKAVKDFFPPELFNRIERIVPFQPLGDEVAAAIADKELAALLGRRGLTERNVFVFAHQSATERMAREAFDSRAGARSVRRYLETRVASLLAEHLAATARPEMELIRLYDRDGAYRLRSEALREAEPRPGDSPLRPLLDQPAAQLRGALADALERLDRLREDGLEALGERIAGHLAKASESARDADAVYLLDGLRREADALRERLEA
ncbi:MAG TPA: AAA family ATPase, partial [Polyangiaceae bacterium LLY-WYZ-15_(1-7)]|nr:AAA family ATPase [Polyangiaceae bacterium LLY-WYZ-15_(1-7)]